MNTWQIEPFGSATDERVERLTALYQVCQAVDDPTTVDQVRARLGWPNHDLNRDRWVAARPDCPDEWLGTAWVYAQTAARCYFSATILPGSRRQGLGTRLLEQSLSRAKEMGCSLLACSVSAADQPANEFLRAEGFSPLASSWLLEYPSGLTIPQPKWPSGYTMRSYAEVQDLDILVGVMNRCYADMWGHTENTPGAVNKERVLGWMQRHPTHFLPEGMILAYGPDGSPVGFSKAELDGERLVVDGPGVAPEHRSAGLHIPLALSVMAFLRTQASGPLFLQSWGDSPTSIADYQSMGYHLNEQYIEYGKEL